MFPLTGLVNLNKRRLIGLWLQMTRHPGMASVLFELVWTSWQNRKPCRLKEEPPGLSFRSKRRQKCATFIIPQLFCLFIRALVPYKMFSGVTEQWGYHSSQLPVGLFVQFRGSKYKVIIRRQMVITLIQSAHIVYVH